MFTTLPILVYLRCLPSTCLNRVQKRQREEERTAVDINSLKSLHERYEDWLIKPLPGKLSAKVVVVDANQDEATVLAKVEQHLENLLCHN